RRDQGERRTDRDVDPASFARRLGDRAELGQSGEAAVHLPVAGDELAAEVHGWAFTDCGVARRLARFYDPRKSPSSGSPWPARKFKTGLHSAFSSSCWLQWSSPASARAARAASAALAAAARPAATRSPRSGASR